MHDYKELKVWQQARILVNEVYLITGSFAKEERFGITSQIRRSVISIPLNIAEGAGQETPKDYGRFLDIAIGSAFELETQIILFLDLDMTKEDDFDEMDAKIKQVQKMIYGLKKSLK